jgi:uncharacterized membrane protein (DUF2068 family)
MRVVPRRWSTETWVCSIRGHVTPAATVARVRPSDAALGVDVDGCRFARCLRCDAWIPGPVRPAADATSETLPPLDQLDQLELPRRGRALDDAVIVRLIAIERAVHCVIFGAIAIALAFVATNLGSIHHSAQSLVNQLQGAVQGRNASRGFLNREARRLLDLHHSTVMLLLATAAVYCVVEGIEAVGLWHERRWAEYLTALATAGFLPFELNELAKHVTIVRIGALVINLAVLIWLVWAKHLFGIKGGAATLTEQTDWDTVLAGPCVSTRASATTVATTR